WSERTHPDDRAEVTRARAAFLAGERDAFDVEHRFQRTDGAWIWLRARSGARYRCDGQLQHYGMAMDVTKQRQLEESLRQTQKIEAVGQLAGGVAHDFNNILAAILTNCQSLLETLAEDDPCRLDALDISTAAERAVTLTRQL